MQKRNRVAPASPHAWRWCAGLPLMLVLAACGVAEPASQPQAASQRPTSAPAPIPESTAPPSLEPPTARPSPSLSAAPFTPTPQPASIPATAGQPAVTAVIAPDAATSAPATPAASPIPSGAWQTYRSDSAGYSVEYPADWTVSEQANGDGSFVTTFSFAGSGPAITVATMPGEIAAVNDLPNTRCEEVTIGGLPGTRCFDTISRSVSITLVGQGKTFIIAAAAKHLDAQTFERFLDHFAPITGP